MKWPAFFSWPTITPPEPSATPTPLGQRLLWMAGIWIASVLLLLVIGLLIRMVLR